MPLTNQLGTGALPPDEEERLVSQGTRFAAYFTLSDGASILITSRHVDIHQRWAEQLTRSYEREFGLPTQYRIPALNSSAV